MKRETAQWRTNLKSSLRWIFEWANHSPYDPIVTKTSGDEARGIVSRIDAHTPDDGNRIGAEIQDLFDKIKAADREGFQRWFKAADPLR